MLENNPADYFLKSALPAGNADTPRPPVMIGAAASKNLRFDRRLSVRRRTLSFS
jgi:hypothetical protein